MDAILRGDHSGTVVHSAFVHGAQVLGMPFLTGFNDSHAALRFHTRRTQVGWECLADLFKGDDHRTKAQAAVNIVSGHILICRTQMALLYIQKGCDFIKAGNLQFVPPGGRPPEFSEELHETLNALSQMIYWANYLFLMRGGPEPRSTVRLEREFRQELPVSDITSIYMDIEFTSYYSRLIRFSSRCVL